MDRDVKSVLVAAAYGIAGGTVLGLVAWPIAQDSRAIFIGSSMGLYLGTAVGFYHIGSREDPENPLRRSMGDPEFRVASQGTPFTAVHERRIPIFNAVVFRF